MRELVVVSLVASAIALVACKKTAATPSGPHTCTSDDECVLSCDRQGNCCHNPYCEQAAHRDDASEARAYNEKHCTPNDYGQCPQIGSRAPRDYTVGVKCRSGACVAEKTPLADGSTPL